jgi:hypothetical protein
MDSRCQIVVSDMKLSLSRTKFGDLSTHEDAECNNRITRISICQSSQSPKLDSGFYLGWDKELRILADLRL